MHNFEASPRNGDRSESWRRLAIGAAAVVIPAMIAVQIYGNSAETRTAMLVVIALGSAAGMYAADVTALWDRVLWALAIVVVGLAAFVPGLASNAPLSAQATATITVVGSLPLWMVLWKGLSRLGHGKLN